MRKMDNCTYEELCEIVKHNTSYKACLRELGYTAGISGDTLKAFRIKLQDAKIDVSHFVTNEKGNIPNKYSNEIVFTKDSNVSQKCLRNHYYELYPPNCCSICGISTMQNNLPLAMILDHINGQNHDNRIENLRWVCPNCNSQLSTTGPRNWKNINV